MSSLPTPPRLGLRVPLPPPPSGQQDAPEIEGLAEKHVLEGRYQIEERIGEGGVGFVYRALQLKLHRRVAVKLLQRDMVGDEELRPRFEREAITLAALSHPNIVSIQDYGMVRGQPFLVMELLEGRTLRETVDVEGALAPERALMLTRQLLQALVYAHELGIVHRDLKPANLLVQSLPAQEHLKVLDFGLVKLLPGSYLDRGVQLSRVGFTFGTPAYMSPEHATGGQVDARSDLYSVGILLFELLTGEKPYDGELHEIIRHHLSSPIPRLSERRPELAARPDLQRIVERCLAKLRDERFPSAVELLHAVDAAIAHTNVLSAQTASSSAQANGKDGAEELTIERPLGVKRELKLWGTASRRVVAALGQWLRYALMPWLKRRTSQLRASVEALGARTEHVARESWVRAKPHMEQAKQQLAKAAQQVEARLRPSKAPPQADAAEAEGAPASEEGQAAPASGEEEGQAAPASGEEEASASRASEPGLVQSGETEATGAVDSDQTIEDATLVEDATDQEKRG